MTEQSQTPEDVARETLYIYAVVSDPGYRPEVTGIDGAPLQVVDAAGGLRAVAHAHTAGPFEGPDEHVKRWVLEHSDVVDDAWRQTGAALPVSFNVIVRPDAETGASAEQQLAGWLESAEPRLRPLLTKLQDTTELRVEVSLDGPQHVADDPEIIALKADMELRPAGVRRLLSKRLEKKEKGLVDHAADQLYTELRPRIAERCLDLQEYRRTSKLPGQIPVLTAACLVRSNETEALGTELTSIREQYPGVTIRFLGPWPPYSFADMTASGDSMHS